MIFVIIGSEKFPFDRLVREIDALKADGTLQDEVYIQLGACRYEPLHCAWDRYLPFARMCDRIERANLVIAHAGAGTTLLCLKYRKPTILVTRRKRHGEHVDDHQVHFAEIMERARGMTVAYEVEDLRERLTAGRHAVPAPHRDTNEVKRLIAYLDALVAGWPRDGAWARVPSANR